MLIVFSESEEKKGCCQLHDITEHVILLSLNQLMLASGELSVHYEKV